MKKSRRHSKPDLEQVRVPVEEELLASALGECEAERVLCTTLGRGQFALLLAERFARTRVVCHVLDIFQAEQARRLHRAELEEAVRDARLEVLLSPDFPTAEVDLVAIPVNKQGDAELTRELLQEGHQALRMGGRMWVSTRNRDDTWLHEEMHKLFPKVTRRPLDEGVLYLATKTEPLKKLKHFDCEFAFRDEGRLIKIFSRPGVFSHRSLDAGARAVMKAMTIQPGQKVLDLGCGSGALSLAAALRAEGVQVTAIDAHVRAIQCTERGAAANGISSISTILTADGETGAPGTYDVVLANPPYYSHYKIAEIFLQAAVKALKPEGEMVVVTKAPNWFLNRLGELFYEVNEPEFKQYYVFHARRPKPLEERPPFSEEFIRPRARRVRYQENPRPQRQDDDFDF